MRFSTRVVSLEGFSYEVANGCMHHEGDVTLHSCGVVLIDLARL